MFYVFLQPHNPNFFSETNSYVDEELRKIDGAISGTCIFNHTMILPCLHF